MREGLRIQLLDGFHVARPNEDAAPELPARIQELLALLVLHRETPQERRRIAFLLWPESPDSQALTNLRQLLHSLRRAFPEVEELLDIQRRTLQWSPSRPVQVDVIALEDGLARTRAAWEDDDVHGTVTLGRAALELFRGDLLPSCYGSWMEPHRAGLLSRVREGIQLLIQALEVQRGYEEATRWASRLVGLDPLREASHRSLIRLQLLAGERAGALCSYRDLESILQRELGVEPAPETRATIAPALREEGRDLASDDGAVTSAPGEGPSAATAAVPGPRWETVAGGQKGFAAEDTWSLVGRQEEWSALCAAWEEARRGTASMVFVEGEAGIGKTHLAEAFAASAGRQGARVALARCWEAEGAIPFSPVAQWLRALGPRVRVGTLEPAWRVEVARVLPEVETEATDVPADLRGPSEPWQRLRLFEGLARALLARRDPTVLLLDDLQWSDGDTLDWIHFLLRFDPQAPLLILATIRAGEPARTPGFASRILGLRRLPFVRHVPLGRMAREETIALVRAMVGRDVPEEEAHDLHQESEGNPLFVVELIRLREARTAQGAVDQAETAEADAAESGLGGAPRTPLPSRVRWMIRSRLERLSDPAKDLLPLLATVGRDFTVDVLRQAEPTHPQRLVPALEELVRRQVIREREDGALDFTHDKIREVAYREMTEASRALLHERVARALIRTHRAAPEAVAARVARHLQRAGLAHEAIPWRERAAHAALDLHAYAEAANHLERALALLKDEPEGRGRTEHELEIRTTLGVPLVALHHYSGARVWRTYRKAAALCRELDRPVAPPILRALALAGLMRSRLPDVVELGEELMEAAHRHGDPMLGVEAHYVLGVVRYWQGGMEDSRRHLASALKLYHPERVREHVALFAQDPGVVCGVRLALTEWHLGLKEEARQRCLQALERARDLGHPMSLAYGRCFGSWVLIECGDLAEARREAGALVREASEHGVAVWSTWGRITEGYLLAEAGNHEEGVKAIRQAVARFEAWELTLGAPYHQGLLARALLHADCPEEAKEAVDRGLILAERTGQRFWDGELLRASDELRPNGRTPGMRRRS